MGPPGASVCHPLGRSSWLTSPAPPGVRPPLTPLAACLLLRGAILAPGGVLAKDKFRVAWSIDVG